MKAKKTDLIKNTIRQKILEVEEKHGVTLSNIQKILLSIEGPIASTLDVLYGDVNMFMLTQHFEEANKDTANLLEIAEGDEIDFREVIIHKYGRPLIYSMTIIPASRCSEAVLNDLHAEKLTTSKIMHKYHIETFREIYKITIEEPDATLKELFKTDEKMLTREYVMIHHGKKVMWTRESYPLSFFTV